MVEDEELEVEGCAGLLELLLDELTEGFIEEDEVEGLAMDDVVRAEEVDEEVGFGGIAEELDDVLGPVLELETDGWEDVVGFVGA